MKQVIDITPVNMLRNYCETRWKIQDNYFEECYKILRRYTTALFFILLVCATIMNTLLAVKVNSLQQQIDAIEQTWSE